MSYNFISTVWMRSLISKFALKMKSLIQVKKSEKNFKFGGGEQRTSLDCVKLPCYMETVEGERKLLFIIAEVVGIDLPLIVGGRGFKKLQPCKVDGVPG